MTTGLSIRETYVWLLFATLLLAASMSTGCASASRLHPEEAALLNGAVAFTAGRSPESLNQCAHAAQIEAFDRSLHDQLVRLRDSLDQPEPSFWSNLWRGFAGSR